MTENVSQILAEKHDITAQPGAKVDCPFCGHRTFSIKLDDSLGKCFHPSCGRFITPFRDNNDCETSFTRFLDKMFHDFHADLMAQKNSDHRTAYSYLIEERGIHPQVVTDSMLGVVPPNYDLASKFDSLIAETRSALGADGDDARSKKDHPKKLKEPPAKDYLAFLTEAREKLERCLSSGAGWLCFFYTDAAHRIVAIRFREPYSKKMIYFKPYQNTGGLFGHGLFSPFEAVRSACNEFLIVTEGELNQLQLQSLWIEKGYLFACAVGGVMNTDLKTIKRVAKYPIICYDNDVNGAGFKLVEKARETMSVMAFTTPYADSDLDSFIRSFGSDHEAARQAVKSLIKARKLYPRYYESVSKEIFATRQKQGKNDTRRDFEIHSRVADTIRTDMLDRGKFYHDGQTPYFFFEVEKRLIAISPDDDECCRMLSQYGINRAEYVHRYLLEALWAEAFEHGTKTEVHRLAHYSPKTHTLYLYNNQNQIYRISADVVDTVDNGTDGVLFLSDTNAESFEVGEPGRDLSMSWLDRCIVSKINFADDILRIDERRLIFTLWFYSLFFESIMPTKPILAFIGPKGSGKSITLRKVGKLLSGVKFDVTPLSDDRRDFDAAVTNAPFVAIDNADARSNWLNDRLATMATGGVIEKRQLYTTNKLVKIPAHCFLALTSRTPHFRRDDVADRLLIMKVDRFRDFEAERTLLEEVIENRDVIMSEVVGHLQEVVRALKASDNVNDSGGFRMADFADFAVRVARYAGVENRVKAIFGKLTREQSTFTLEDEPIFDLLCDWVPNNQGCEVTNADLCRQLADLAEAKGTEFPYRGRARSFAQKMTHLRANLREFFNITERSAGGRKKLFSFSTKPESKEH